MDKSNKNIDKDIENMLHQLSHTKEDKELKDRWKQILSDDYNVKRSPAKPKTKYLKPFLAVIALVTIAVIAFYYISLPKIENGSKKDTDYLIAEVQILTNPIYDHRGNEQTKDNYSSRAYSMLKANNYKQAIEIYTNAKNNTKLNEYDTYHLGLAYLKNGNYENSISTLQKLKVNSLSYKPEINWLLVLNYIETKKYDKAELILNYIIENKHYKSQQAIDVLKLID